MKRITRFNESHEDFKDKNENYMFFSNLEHICRMVTEMSGMDESEVDEILTKHDWANDHISKSMESVQHVYNFLLACQNGEEPEALDYDTLQNQAQAQGQSEVQSEESDFDDNFDYEEEDEVQMESKISRFKNFK